MLSLRCRREMTVAEMTVGEARERLEKCGWPDLDVERMVDWSASAFKRADGKHLGSLFIHHYRTRAEALADLVALVEKMEVSR